MTKVIPHSYAVPVNQTLGRRIGRLVAAAGALAALCATIAPAAEPLDVYTDSYPVTYFSERIGGAHVHVTFPAPTEGDPAFWQPAPETIVRYQQADLVVVNGATFAKWIDRATLRDSRVVDTAAGFQDRWIKIESAVTHSHGPGGMHSHAGWAFTTWLDPLQAIEQARAIEAAFAKARPDATADFEAGLAGLVADLQPLADTVTGLRAKGVESVVFDPAGNRPSEGDDYLAVMGANVERLRRIADAARAEPAGGS